MCLWILFFCYSLLVVFCYPKWFKSHTPICLKNFLKALPFMALFYLLLMLSGDIEVNPGPKSKINQRTAKSRFISDLNTDASLTHSDPKELATKCHVNVRTVRRWLRDCLPLRFKSCNPLFDKPELFLERDELLCEKYDVHIRSIRRWKHDYQHSRFACSVDMDNADNELAKKDGVRTATINLWKKDADTQWAIWHEYSEQLIDCSDVFESMCEPICML